MAKRPSSVGYCSLSSMGARSEKIEEWGGELGSPNVRETRRSGRDGGQGRGRTKHTSAVGQDPVGRVSPRACWAEPGWVGAAWRMAGCQLVYSH